MEKDLASLTISNKAEATLGAKALNGALHDNTSFLSWVVLSILWVVSRRVCAPSCNEPAAGLGDTYIIIGGPEARLVGTPSMAV
jgi:hypothetical protein